MSLSFLHPLYLYGLVAISLPLLIHLLNRRRLKRLRFPAVRFVLLSQRRIARTYRLRHWILLALRTFAIFLLVLLLAHPIIQTGAGLFAGGGTVNLTVIVDNSLSMQWSREGEGFKEAKEAVRLLLSSLKGGDRAAVVTTNPWEQGRPRLRGEREALLRELEQTKIAAGTADFSLALNRAYELLREPAAQKEIWLITDMALTGWDRFTLSALKQYDPLIPLKVVRVGARTEALNATIKEVSMRGEGVGVGLPIHLEATIVNFSNKEAKDLLLQLNIDDRGREQKSVSVPPQAESVVSFQFTPTQAGSYRGYVALKKDGLAGNSTYYFTLHAQDRIRVLVVDGDPQTSLVQSETFFLTRALDPSGERDASLFLPTVIIPEGLSSVPLASYQVVILCNVPAIPDPILPRLRDYVRQGGGLLFFLGDRVQAEDYNSKLFQSSPAILPVPLGGKKILPEIRDGEKIERVDAGHAALQPFADRLLKESLTSARVRGYFTTETQDGSVLLALTNRVPLLQEKRLGSGRLLLFTSSADRDWSDLPLKTAYLPLVRALVSYLSGGNRGGMDSGIQVGSTKALSFPAPYVGKGLRIYKPDRKEKEIALKPDGDKAAAVFHENDLPGFYALSMPGALDKGSPLIYAVNSPFLESRLEPISESELQAKLHPIRAEVLPIESLKQGGKRLDLSLSLLLLLIVTLTLEGWLAERF